MEIEITFSCPCGAFVDQAISCDGPEMEANTEEASKRVYWRNLVCDGCTKDFDVRIIASFSGTTVQVAGLADLHYDVIDDIEVEEIAAEVESTRQLDIYKKVTTDVIAILRRNRDQDLQSTLNNMLFAQVVTAVETYLSSSFISTVVNSDILIRRLVETDPELAKRQFSLREIFTQWQDLKLLVAKYLKDLIFHDLKKVKPMYESVLDIDFGDISWLFKAVLIRHDCVHRSGFDKDGNQKTINDDAIIDLVKKATHLVSDIEEQLLFTKQSSITEPRESHVELNEDFRTPDFLAPPTR